MTDQNQQSSQQQAGAGTAQPEKKKRSLADAIAARGIPVETWRAVCSSIFPGADPESVLLAFDYCKARGLDIMKKPCHIVPMEVEDARTGRKSYRDVIMQSVGELRSTAFRTKDYAGQDKPVYGETKEFEFGKTKISTPEWIEITVYRLDRQGERRAFTHREYFIECAATKSGGELNRMWKKRPIGQHSKCTEAGALRKAFPEELGTTWTLEEMEGRTIVVNGDQEIIAGKEKSTAGAAGIIAALEQQPEERLPQDLGDGSQDKEPATTEGLKKALSELNTAAGGELSQEAKDWVKDL